MSSYYLYGENSAIVDEWSNPKKNDTRTSEVWNIAFEDDTYTLTPKGDDFSYTLIAYHGFGGSAKQYLRKLVPYDNHQLIPKNFKVVIPQAPEGYVDSLQKNVRSWFSSTSDAVYEDGMTVEEIQEIFDQDEIEAAIVSQKTLFEKLVADHDGDSSKVFILGQGMGCAISLATFMFIDEAPGGIACANGLMPFDLSLDDFSEVDWDLKA